MVAVFKREVKAFFLTPIGYVYIGIFLFLSGMFFSLSLLNQVVNYTEVLGTMVFTLLFVTPILTMKLLAEEKKNGTDQLLLTSPVSLTEIILGKYFAALFVFLCTVLITLIYPIILSKFSSVDFYAIATGYLGFFLIGAGFIAIGLFASSLAENQTVAAIFSFCILVFLWLLDLLKNILNLSERSQKIFNWFSVLERYQDFEAGLLNISSVIFFISLVALFLFLTYRTIEKRRWSRG